MQHAENANVYFMSCFILNFEPLFIVKLKAIDVGCKAFFAPYWNGN
jgi:hypothetical protein